MSDYKVEDVVAQYIKLRDKKAEITARHKEELAPYSEAMEKMEAWLLAQMQAVGADSFKTQHGTAFKASAASVTMADPVVFKSYVLAPAPEAIRSYLLAQGIELEPQDIDHINTILAETPRWNLADFRAAKKGVQEYIEEKQVEVPGVSVNSIVTVNIRRN